MHRPLREPLYLRIWHLIKGVLFYNTVYWQKASDNLDMPSLTRAERERHRPVANLDVIKPRDKPRARLDTFRGAQISNPVHETREQEDEPRSGINEELPDLEDEPSQKKPDGQYVKRRKYKRRRTGGSHGGDGFFRRVFGK